MIINKIEIRNFKLFSKATFDVNEDINIFVGDNDTGKSTILEAIQLVTTGKLRGFFIERVLGLDLFSHLARDNYKKELEEKSSPELPSIIVEIYCKNQDQYSGYKGTNNINGTDCPGIHFEVSFDEQFSEDYKELLKTDKLNEIPIEYYSVKSKYFNGDPVDYRRTPFKMTFVDTTKNNYGRIVDNFVNQNITDYLDKKDRADLSFEFRNNKRKFSESQQIIELNETLDKEVVLLDNKKIKIDLKEENKEAWKNHITIVVDKSPFESLGLGTRNTIKIELALRKLKDITNIILIEEPENNLSHTNMSKLINKITVESDRQVFISTHSSFVANKVGLNKLSILGNGVGVPLNRLDNDTMEYFVKLPGYETLRLVLSQKSILVEGPSDELIIQRAFKDTHGVLPIEMGIDVITIDSLAFKRYLDIALLIRKKVSVVTDNDGNIKKNIETKYSDYIPNDFIKFYYEQNEKIKTLEPSILNANIAIDTDWEKFEKIISKNGSQIKKTQDEITTFMINNKTEWSFRVFDNDENIKYPKYIIDAIK